MAGGLGINIQTQVSPTGDVTLTINGKARTFYFTPPANGIVSYLYTPQYTPEPGLYGSLVNTGDNCDGVLLHVGNVWECAINNSGQIYQATGYQYTDPYGRIYTLASDGTLQSIQDLNNNTLTITPNGITSSNGLNVPFVRDSQGRITQITDTLGNQLSILLRRQRQPGQRHLPEHRDASAVSLRLNASADAGNGSTRQHRRIEHVLFERAIAIGDGCGW